MEGILLVDKPIGYTTHDAVDVLRRRAGIRRIGHAGTLDPMATGLVVLLVGGATRLFDEFSSHDKTYEGILTLGIETDTQDFEGRIEREREVGAVDERRLEEAFASFTGRIEQRVPRYSSAKMGGRKCYEMARKNVDFERPTKTVEVRKLELRALAGADAYFLADVSKGTYIRALCEGIGERMGTGAALSALRRTRSGPFRIADAVPLDALKRFSRADVEARLLPRTAAS